MSDNRDDRDALSALQSEIEAAIDGGFSVGLTNASVLGLLCAIKHDLLQDMREADDDE